MEKIKYLNVFTHHIDLYLSRYPNWSWLLLVINIRDIYFQRMLIFAQTIHGETLHTIANYDVLFTICVIVQKIWCAVSCKIKFSWQEFYICAAYFTVSKYANYTNQIWCPNIVCTEQGICLEKGNLKMTKIWLFSKT